MVFNEIILPSDVFLGKQEQLPRVNVTFLQLRTYSLLAEIHPRVRCALSDITYVAQKHNADHPAEFCAGAHQSSSFSSTVLG